jgi:acyl-CoA synthetase (AMP-forming)/AMP-acid ligase II
VALPPGHGSESALQSNDKMLQGPSCERQPDDVLALRLRASEAPDAIALLAPDRDPLTYLQLWNHTQALRKELADFGIRPGDVTALGMAGGQELITAFLAVATTGACAPLDPTLTESECHFYLSRLGAKTLIVGDKISGAARAARSLGMRVLTMHVPTNRPAGVFELQHAGEAAIAPGRETDAALLLFTSATTDSPPCFTCTAWPQF